MNRTHVVLPTLLFVFLTAGGCGLDSESAPPASLSDYLATPEALPIAAGASSVEVNDLQLPVISGRLDIGIEPDGRLRIDAVELALADTTIRVSQLPPPGLRLKNMKAHVEGPLSAWTRWSGPGESMASMQIDADILLEWSIVAPSGKTLELTAQRIKDVPLDLDVYLQQDGTVGASLSGTRSGPFWNWGGVFTLADLIIELHARSSY